MKTASVRSLEGADRPWTFWRALTALGFLALFGLLIAWFVQTIRANPWFLVFLAVMVIIGVLMVRFPKLESAFNTLFSGYFSFCIWSFVAIAPAYFAFWLAHAIEAQAPLWLQVAALGLWACLLTCLIWFLATDDSRTRLFDSLKRLGRFAPVAYAVNVLLLALPFFGSLTSVLAARGLVTMEGDARRTIDFYLWHFLDAIPFLKVNETILWAQPMAYHQSRVGWLVLIFKAAVILPVIAAFRGYWEYAQPKRSSAGQR